MAFSPRTTSDGIRYSNYYYYMYNGHAISTRNQMPNCTAYAYGRTMELCCKVNGRDWYAMNADTSAGNWYRPTCAFNNARFWYQTAVNEGLWSVSRTPQLGAIACFNNKVLPSGDDDGGHVAIVEAIHSDGTVDLSFSEYQGRFFVYVKNATLQYGQYMTVNGSVYGFGTFRGYIINPYTAGSIPDPEPKPVPIVFRRNDKVKIISFGNANSYGTGRKAYGIGWDRTVKKVWIGRPYPYQVGNINGGTTGFYKAEALKLIRRGN